MTKETLQEALNIWIASGPSEEQESRIKTSDKIVKCWEEKLDKLDLSNLELTSLPEVIGELELTALDLARNKLTYLPDSFENFSKLKSLYLNKNSFETIPHVLEKINSLKFLNISENNLPNYETSEVILEKQNRGLKIEFNKISPQKKKNNRLIYGKEKIEDWVNQVTEESRRKRHEAGQKIFTCWENEANRLDLRSAGIDSLPDLIEEFNFLHEIDLSDNSFRAFPQAITQLSSLKHLSLKNNRLSAVPEGIRFPLLESLDLGGNLIADFPEPIKRLQSLKNLSLKNNRLNALPEGMSSTILPQLQTLDLRENLLARVPYDLLQRVNFQIFLQNNNISRESLSTIRNALSLMSSRSDILEETPNHSEEIPHSSRVLDTILNLSQNDEERKNLVIFLSGSEFADFKSFLEKCVNTSGWARDEGIGMSNAFFNLINQMRKNENLKAKCLSIASATIQTTACVDTFSLSYVQMILAEQLDQKPISEMDYEELLEFSKRDAVISFLCNKAEQKIYYIQSSGESFDEIEVYLEYLRCASELGFNIPASEMRFSNVSKVTVDDRENAIREFEEISLISRAANHAYEDESIKRHPLILRIVNHYNNLSDIDYYPKPNERDIDFQNRITQSQKELDNLAIRVIADSFKAIEKGKKSPSTLTNLYVVIDDFFSSIRGDGVKYDNFDPLFPDNSPNNIPEVPSQTPSNTYRAFSSPPRLPHNYRN